METANGCIRKALRLAEDLVRLADEGDLSRSDDGCGVLFGIIRDCGFKIRADAERERDEHKLRGDWPSEAQPPPADPSRALGEQTSGRPTPPRRSNGHRVRKSPGDGEKTPVI